MGKGAIYGDAGASAQALNNEPIAVGRDWSISYADQVEFRDGDQSETYVSGKHVGDPNMQRGLTRLQKFIGGRMGTRPEKVMKSRLDEQEFTQQEPNDVTNWQGRDRGGIDYGYADSNALAVSARGVQDGGGSGPPLRIAQLWKGMIRDWAGLQQHGYVQTQYQLHMRHESFTFKQQYIARQAKSISGSLAQEGPTASNVRIPAVFVPRSIS